MQELNGTISDRIRKLFGKDNAAYKPPADRNDSPDKGRPVPKSSGGGSLGAKPGRKSKR